MMNKGLEKAFNRINNVLSYSNSEHEKNRTINKRFKRNAKVGKGEISIKINFYNISPQELINTLDKLQEFSNELLQEVIPEDIIN